MRSCNLFSTIFIKNIIKLHDWFSSYSNIKEGWQICVFFKVAELAQGRSVINVKMLGGNLYIFVNLCLVFHQETERKEKIKCGGFDAMFMKLYWLPWIARPKLQNWRALFFARIFEKPSSLHNTQGTWPSFYILQHNITYILNYLEWGVQTADHKLDLYWAVGRFFYQQGFHI